MKKTIKFAAALLIGTSLLSTGCLEETFPQQGTVTVDQAGDAPNAFNNFVTACTSTLAGEFLYAGNTNMYPYDFGYPSFLLQRDVMGQDIALEDTGYEQFTTWYTCGVGLGPDYAICQVPWTIYYGWIKNCNVVISLAGEKPDEEHIVGAGIAHAMRAFYYMDLVTVSRLQRNPTVKTEIQMRNFETSIPVGFFTYPISQAADITAFRATTVPVGEDQEPMIEQAREIVRRFNYIYGETLVEPEILLPDNAACLRLPGTDGKAKMSKSLGNCIYLSDSADEVQKKVKSMYTDPDHLRVQDPGKLEGNTVFTYLDAFCRPEHFGLYLPEYPNLDELKAHYQRGGLGDMKVKKFLNEIMQETLEPIRNRRKEFEKDIPAIYDMLKKGCETARETAAATLDDVRKAMKINYFDDAELIAEQIKKFGGE